MSKIVGLLSLGECLPPLAIEAIERLQELGFQNIAIGHLALESEAELRRVLEGDDENRILVLAACYLAGVFNARSEMRDALGKRLLAEVQA